MGQGKGIREVAYIDCSGGGQVVVEKNIAYVGSMASPDGTMIFDVGDPKNPRQISRLDMVAGAHSHKVRVANGLMLVNREFVSPQLAPPDFKGGLGIFDVSDPRKPKRIIEWTTSGKGVHRFDFDGEFAYISATEEGYVGHILKILDLRNPARPEEVSRWWIPGQWTAGGEQPTWNGANHRIHHPLRLGNRLYTSCWLAGLRILDIDDMAKPQLVSELDWSPPFASPTHTALPIPFPVRGRRLMIVADEDTARSDNEPPAFIWMVDITDERHPVPFGSFQVEAEDGSPRPPLTGCHQPCEKVTGTEIQVAWFAHGLRVVDFSNPHRPRESAWYLPTPAAGVPRVQSNDVTVDDRGLIYLIDRVRGLHILERE
ncbi:MAG: hypothetical protein HY661_03185 [Betaproteobacteria bacterium]|nr:hypothetical protein [Betaproteobacteria bacterium]